jgi:hypothetical protein
MWKYRGSGLWKALNFPKQLAWENGWLKTQVEELKAEVKEVQASRDRVRNRMSMVEERIVDILKIGHASDFTRQEINDMSLKEFEENEHQIDADSRDGKCFLP